MLDFQNLVRNFQNVSPVSGVRLPFSIRKGLCSANRRANIAVRGNRSWFFVLVILFLIIPANFARPQIRARVDLVVVPATVKDSQGKLINGLSKEDFLIREDGIPQTITNFDIDPLPLSAAIVIDDGMNGNQLRRLYPSFSPSIFTTLAAGFTPNDQMAAFRYDRLVYKLSDFTSDSGEIERRFDVLRTFALTRPDETADLLGEKGPHWVRSFINVLNFGHKSERPADGALHDAVYEAATALQSQAEDHRKIIFIISDGRAVGANAHTFDQTVDMLLKNQIQVFGVSTTFATFGSFGTLTSYAHATGGDVFPGTSTASMETAFGRITEAARYEYVLGYVSSNKAGQIPVFRTIEVKTRSPKYVVLHRKGYLQYVSPQ
jgi:VWFA-related protein